MHSPTTRNDLLVSSTTVVTCSVTASAPLSARKKRNVLVDAYVDLVDVVNFLFLPQLGCIHLRSEWYLHSGANTELLVE